MTKRKCKTSTQTTIPLICGYGLCVLHFSAFIIIIITIIIILPLFFLVLVLYALVHSVYQLFSQLMVFSLLEVELNVT